MYYKHLLIVFLIVFAAPVNAQIEETYIVEFSKDDYTILEKESEDLLLFLESIRGLPLGEIKLIGHTDSDGSDEYNIELSKNRVEAVSNFLATNGFSKDVQMKNHFGEKQPVDVNTTDAGQQHNRRVEIIAKYAPMIVAPEEIEEIPIDCSKDTLIELAKGTLIKMNKCDYERNPDCVKISEILDAQSMIEEGVHTETPDGQPLISAGMLKYDICDGVKVQAFIPLRLNCENDDMDLWEQREDGSWKKISTETVKPVQVNERRYLPVMLSGSGFINMDKLPPRSRLKKVKFKVKKGYELNSVSLYCDCAMWGARGEAKNKRKRKVVLRVLCCPDPQVIADVNIKGGRKLNFESRSLSELQQANNLGKCRSTVRKKFWFFRRWNKAMYRKYRIKAIDFDEG
jgi:OmpA family